MCAAFATAEEYDLQKLNRALQQDQSFTVTPLPEGMPSNSDKQSKLSLLFLDAWNAVHATVRSEGMEAAGDVFFFRSVYPLAWVLRHSYHLGCLELKLLAMNVCPSTSVAYRFGTVVSWNILQSKVRTIVLWSVVWMLEW